jgi:hypothetical protein
LEVRIVDVNVLRDDGFDPAEDAIGRLPLLSPDRLQQVVDVARLDLRDRERADRRIGRLNLRRGLPKVGERNAKKYTATLIILCFNISFAVEYFMSICTESISRGFEALIDLEQQMSELLALRRALCLINASRNWPAGARRHPARTGVRSVRAGRRLSDDRYSAGPAPK